MGAPSTHWTRWAEMKIYPMSVSQAMYEPQHRQVIVEGIGSVVRDARAKLPHVADEVEAWIKWHSSTDEPADYYTHPAAFPSFLLPWWAEGQATGAHDLIFQTDLARATGNLYYYTRIVDNLMDNHPTVERKLLPVAGYLVFQSQIHYRKHFPDGHPFWEWGDRIWSSFCDACAKDIRLMDIDEDTFIKIVSQKCSGAKLAVGAVLYKCDRLDLLQPWMEWIDLYSSWHILQEDMFDWKPDSEGNTPSYILDEARRRKGEHELLLVWLADEGVDWATAKLKVWMQQLRDMTFAPPETQAYLRVRDEYMLAQVDERRPALAFISRLAALGKRQPQSQG